MSTFWGSVTARCWRLPTTPGVCRVLRCCWGSSLCALLSPSVVCGLVLVCADSCCSVGRCQSSDADESVEVSLTASVLGIGLGQAAS